jgi:hypothetical protein
MESLFVNFNQDFIINIWVFKFLGFKNFFNLLIYVR